MKYLVFLLCTILVVSSTAQNNLPSLIGDNDNFNILTKLLTDNGLLSNITQTKGVTIFAPTDKAFTRTAKSLGCGNTRTEDAVIECFNGFFLPPEIATMLKYHVVPRRMTKFRVLRTKMYKTLENKNIKRIGLTLVDLTAGIPNPQLILTMMNLKYNNGIVHAVHRVLLPFINYVKNPCVALKEPIVGANGNFYKLYQITKISKCEGAMDALDNCEPQRVCRRFGARLPVTRKYNVGRVVAAITTCRAVANALDRCSNNFKRWPF